MLTQSELIESARIAQGNCSHYRISQMLGITSAYMTRLRASENIVSPAMALKLAELAGLDPAYVLASIEHERAARTDTGSEVSRVWELIAERMKGAAAVGILALAAIAGSLAPAPSYATGTHAALVNDLYIMRTRRKKVARGRAR